MSKWCILRDDDRIKEAIRYRIKTLNVTMTQVAKIAGVRVGQVSDYLNKYDEPRHRITQEQLMKICKGLGVNVTLNVSLR